MGMRTLYNYMQSIKMSIREAKPDDVFDDMIQPEPEAMFEAWFDTWTGHKPG